MRITELPTPAVLVDSPKLTRNLSRMQAAANARGLRLRPHAKTHKSPRVAAHADRARRRRHLLREARRGRSLRGRGDRRHPAALPAQSRSTRTACSRWRERVLLSFIVDDPAVADAWSTLAAARGVQLDVLVKVDVGFHRCGIDPQSPAAPGTVRAIAAMPGLRFRGLLSHAGHGYGATSEKGVEAVAVAEAQTAARSGVGVRRAVRRDQRRRHADGALLGANRTGVTELRPGNYAYYDRTQVALGAATWDDCALTVLARVVSRPARDRVILDSGSKTLTNDLARGFINTPGYGAVLRDCRTADPDTSLLVERLSEEHAERPRAGGRNGADHRVARPHHPESFVRGLEPGGPRVARGRRHRCSSSCR